MRAISALSAVGKLANAFVGWVSGASFESTGVGWVGFDELCEVGIRSEVVVIFMFDMFEGPFIPTLGDSAISSTECGSTV